ncbi:MAG: M48 family metallopeptidase [Bacteroidetes bacterium]|nr:M48 family metallopeptidase [Bacteroidota bacterium]
MKKLVFAACAYFLMAACATNPFTGKQTMALVSNDQIFPMAFQQYDQFLSENKVVKDSPELERIKRIGNKIVVAAERYLNANGYQGYLKNYQWEFNLVDDKLVNAWAMPGGKVVVYTGILPIAKNDAGLATVMGHEIAHALANHGQQRMSAGTLQQIGAVGVAVATSGKTAETQNAWMQAYGVGSQVGGMLPFSRAHESEADAIGLILMAIAGYNPDEAAPFWERMKASADGQAPPEFLSTHPSSDTRMANLKQLAPQAKAEARKFGVIIN